MKRSYTEAAVALAVVLVAAAVVTPPIRREFKEEEEWEGPADFDPEMIIDITYPILQPLFVYARNPAGGLSRSDYLPVGVGVPEELVASMKAGGMIPAPEGLKLAEDSPRGFAVSQSPSNCQFAESLRLQSHCPAPTAQSPTAQLRVADFLNPN
ncbi:unnamed protein product [Cuscuta campestris]|uniref:Uncharacterized protein n=1 Tax=Cuscuta campestris TaxID=132261 RepID=A0A484NLP8_9ASTE|nr:unnamed protein product [Cuscuta campestris]